MQPRPIGKSNLIVTPLCLGGNVFGWTIDEATSFQVLDAYLDLGGNFIDTADVYSTWAPGHTGGESEAIVGNWMKARGNRAKVVIATKVGSKMPFGEGLSRAWIMQAVEDSLKRLQTDVIDLYQSHIDDANTPLEETLRAYDDLIRQGKVRVIGSSNYTGARTQEANNISAQHHLARYECTQPFYNFVKREDYERDLEPVLLANQIGCIPYSSLASGFLSGKYRAGQAMPNTPRAGGVQNRYMNDAGWAALTQMEQIAEAHTCTVAQAALAWLMHRPGITAPIASATSVAQMKELMGALDVKLSNAATAV
jgi:aryl-alcohol dehydrogenase-like predicted oxidoreductase